MRPLTSRERRIAALALLVLLVWLVWHVLVELAFLAPLREIRVAQTRLQAQAQHQERIIARGDALRAALAQARDDPSLQAGLLTGDDPNAVAADLMQQILDRIGQYADMGPGCEVTQRMPMTPETSPGAAYQQVKVSLSLECAIEPLESLLHDLEYGQPTLFIDQISIRRPSGASSSGGPGRLRVQMLVLGYMKAEADTPSEDEKGRPS